MNQIQELLTQALSLLDDGKRRFLYQLWNEERMRTIDQYYQWLTQDLGLDSASLKDFNGKYCYTKLIYEMDDREKSTTLEMSRLKNLLVNNRDYFTRYHQNNSFVAVPKAIEEIGRTLNTIYFSI